MAQLDLMPHEKSILRRMIADHDRKSLVAAADIIAPEALTKREHEILILLAEGRSSPQIAKCCSITVHTVKTHRSTILAKLGAQNAQHAVAIAFKRKLIRLEDLHPERP